jgi:hypothetical protein
MAPLPHARAALLAAAAAAAATAVGDAAKFSTFYVQDKQQQVVLGLGFAIHADSVGGADDPLPAATTSVPWDLTPDERARFAQTLRGFRYSRLTLGLHYRGVTDDGAGFVERWPGQAAALAEMAAAAGLEGFDVEYASPAPAWKDTGALVGGSLAGFDAGALAALGDAAVADVQRLEAAGLPVAMWGLQDAPAVGPKGCELSCCGYSPDQYAAAQAAVAAAVRAALPHVAIHASSQSGQYYAPGLSVGDPPALANIDAWSFLSTQLPESGGTYPWANWAYLRAGAAGRPVLSAAFLNPGEPASPGDTGNTALHLINWLSYARAPTWFYGHALLPLGGGAAADAAAAAHALGVWNPVEGGSTDPDAPPPGHWDVAMMNWNAVSGFLTFMPHDSVLLTVQGVANNDPSVNAMAYRYDPGKAAWLHPDGWTPPPRDNSTRGATRDMLTRGSPRDVAARAAATNLVVAVVNALNVSATATVQFEFYPAPAGDAALPTFRGREYGPYVNNAPAAPVNVYRCQGTNMVCFTTVLAPGEIQFWLQG